MREGEKWEEYIMSSISVLLEMSVAESNQQFGKKDTALDKIVSFSIVSFSMTP